MWLDGKLLLYGIFWYRKIRIKNQKMEYVWTRNQSKYYKNIIN